MGFKLFATGLLPEGKSGISHLWFQNGKARNKVRAYTAIPWTKPEGGGAITTKILPPGDQAVTVAEVYHLMYGTDHDPAEWENLQVYIEVRNKNDDLFCLYELYEWES
jgi:hypothetical protein